MQNTGTPNQPFTGQMYQTYPNPTNWNTEVSAPFDTKDLGIVQDQMHHEAISYKKWTVYRDYFTEQPLKEMANSVAQHHKQHFESLQNYLNSHKS